ncbi:hypothetical protein BDY19DRAFT_998884 [Irpex rosettiformis]|uniref:Uncharacterized protein n=1 Tax=Irpex rosettiformis TaxID=378272 RepID=A0ACB8TM34_9APHY|nr:hypothetical protein BDY19DRAFT_998884 [Irpex rosettiformis]
MRTLASFPLSVAARYTVSQRIRAFGTSRLLTDDTSSSPGRMYLHAPSLSSMYSPNALGGGVDEYSTSFIEARRSSELQKECDTVTELRKAKVSMPSEQYWLVARHIGLHKIPIVSMDERLRRFQVITLLWIHHLRVPLPRPLEFPILRLPQTKLALNSPLSPLPAPLALKAAYRTRPPIMSASDPFGVEISLPVSAESPSAMISALGVDDLPLDEFAQMLGQQAYEQYKTQGDLDDLETLSSVIASLDRTDDDHPEEADIVGNLGLALYARFKHAGDLHDLVEAISLQQRANTLTPDDSADKPSRLSNLAAFIDSRFELEGRVEDLAEVIALETRAVGLIPNKHEHKPLLLFNLASSLQRQFEQLGNIEGLESAVALHGRAVELTPDHGPRKPSILVRSGFSLRTRFEQLGNPEDPESAIVRYARAVKLTPDGHPDKPTWLNYSGSSLQTRFEELGNLEDLENAVRLHARALELTPDGHPDKPARLINSGNSLQTRYEQLGNIEDLNSAIALYPRAIEFMDDDHPDKLLSLSNSGRPLQMRFDQLGNLEDLENAIGLHARAVELIPDYHPSYELLSMTYDDFIPNSPMISIISPKRFNIPLTPHPAHCLRRRMLTGLGHPSRVKHRAHTPMHLDGRQGDGNGPPDMMREILADLWNWIVKPTMDVVLTLVPLSTALPHVTWCPTGPLAFLPFHAAGIYPKHESTNAHSQMITVIVVPSHTPTLEALLRPHTKVTAGDTEYPKALVVSQPAAPNCDPIPNTRTEAGIVMSLIEQSTPLDDTADTIRAVLEDMAMHD